MNKMNKFNVVFSADDQYVQHLISALCSMLENTKYAHLIIINILDGGIKEKNREFLTGLVHRYGAEVLYIKVNHDFLKDVVVNGHITEATYYRILIPSLFDESVEKVIYLDCDLLVRDDIYKFWSIDIGSFALGAIRVNEYNRHENLGIPQSADYFNAGVLLINLRKWRKEGISDKVFKFIGQYPDRLKMWDQDALNGVLHSDWYIIDYKWNLRAQMFSLDYVTAGFDSNQIFNQAKNNASIVHFTTASKPWHFLNNHPYKDEYFLYLDISGYNYVKFPERFFLLSTDIVVFGTGKNAEQIEKKLRDQSIHIAYFIDNNREKWDQEFLGKVVKKPNVLLDEKSKFVIIASQFDREISEQLKKMGLREHFHFLRNLIETTDVRAR